MQQVNTHDTHDNAKEQEVLINELRALHQATHEIVSELSLDRVLQRIVHTARRLAQVHYSALLIRDETGRMARFVTAGMSAAQKEKIGPLPIGRGLLAEVFHHGKSIIVNHIKRHPAAVGFPEHHPAMKRLLGVPIIAKGRLIGALYLADKEDKAKFDENDLALVEMLAMHAAIAIENARLYEQSQRLSALEERARFAQDLHDSIIQSLYAEGMMLDQIKLDIDPANQQAHKQLDRSLDMLTHVIQDIRSYIFDLRPQAIQRKGIRSRLEGLVHELRSNVRLPVQLIIDPDIDSYLDGERASHVFHICHEALSNAARHAKAKAIMVRLSRQERTVTIVIEDDGVGFQPPTEIEPGHRGLANIHARADQLGAQLKMESRKHNGTHIELTFRV